MICSHSEVEENIDSRQTVETNAPLAPFFRVKHAQSIYHSSFLCYGATGAINPTEFTVRSQDVLRTQDSLQRKQ